MKQLAQREYWLRGPIPGYPPLLQPVVHALLQARDEVNVLMDGFPDEKLWERPAGAASVGFHLRHLTGVLDRLLTYARGEVLTAGQLDYLREEGVPENDRVVPGGGVPENDRVVRGGGVPENDRVVPVGGLPGGGVPEGGGAAPEGGNLVKNLVEWFNMQVDKALEQIKGTDEGELTAERAVGRDRVPSTVGGLLFHAAEHTQRHVGQLLVTSKVVREEWPKIAR